MICATESAKGGFCWVDSRGRAQGRRQEAELKFGRASDMAAVPPNLHSPAGKPSPPGLSI